MSLNDLIEHTKTQEEAIGKLSSGVNSETDGVPPGTLSGELFGYIRPS